MKFKMIADRNFLFWFIIRSVLAILGVWVFYFTEKAWWQLMIALAVTIIASRIIYDELTGGIELTDDELIIRSGSAKRKVPYADMTTITRVDYGSTGRPANEGFVIRDYKTTSNGETKIVVVDEAKFIAELLKRAPHITNEMEHEQYDKKHERG